MRAIRGIIWDMDGTLYRYSTARFAHFAEKTAYAAQQCGVPDGQSYDYNHLGVFEAIDRWEHAYGMDRARFHSLFHDSIDVSTVVEAIDGVAEDVRRTEVPQVILTHSSRNWACQVLTHIGLSDVFGDDRILALEDVDFMHKHNSRAPFQQALNLLGLDAERDVVVVEDSACNLVHAHALGLGTVLIHHGQPLHPLPSHIHFQYDNPVDFLETLQEQAA